MSTHVVTRVQVDENYAALIGRAVYIFQFYEWAIVSLVDFLEPGFINEYSRAKLWLMSGKVENRFRHALTHTAKIDLHANPVMKTVLLKCIDEFKLLTNRRNALVHAHPDRNQIGDDLMHHHARHAKPNPAMTWPIDEVADLVRRFDEAATRAAELLNGLQKFHSSE